MQDELARHTKIENEFRSALLASNYELSFRRFVRAFDAKFNPDQPRDELGRWTGAEMVAANNASREAECEAQYARDTFICNALRLRSYWERAAERYAACLRGRSIPALRF